MSAIWMQWDTLLAQVHYITAIDSHQPTYQLYNLLQGHAEQNEKALLLQLTTCMIFGHDAIDQQKLTR